MIVLGLVHPAIEYSDKLREQQTLRGGQKLVIETAITGIPTATASWTVNDQPLEPSHNISIETSAGGSKLTLSDVVAQNSGMYKLTAENTVGSATAEFDVIIKGKRLNACNMPLWSSDPSAMTIICSLWETLFCYR